jgi:outer membrane lipoprotein
MLNRSVQTAFFFGILSMLVACAGGISEQARSQVTYTGAFSEVQEDPAGYEGHTVIWGGRVIEIRNQGGVTEIVALQLGLDGKDRPTDSDDSQGRFLIRSARFMDPVIYPPGTLITVVGRLQGGENRLIGEMPYQYPVVDVVELQKYEPQQKTKPRVHIGIGVGGTF